MIRYVKILLTLIPILLFSTNSQAITTKFLIAHWYAPQAGSSICLTDAVAWWANTFTTDGTKLLDKSTSATHEATKAQYLDIDTPYTITFAGMGAGVTLASHGGTATVDLTSGTLTCSVAGTLFDMVLSDGASYSCAESVGTLIAPTISGINGTLVGFTLPADRPEASITGESWNGSDGYVIADGTGTFDSGSYLPATYTSEGTLYQGKAQQNLLVEGHTIDWDGVAYATLGAAVTLSGDFTIETVLTPSLLNNLAILGGANTTEGLYRLTPAGYAQIFIGGTNYLFSSITAMVVDTEYKVVFARVGSNGTVTVYDGDGVLVGTQTITVAISDFVVRELASYSTGTGRFQGKIPCIKFYNASNTLVNHWPIEGRNEASDTQITIYDVVGGNDATVVSATTPLFTETFSPSYLAANGFQVSGINTIPYPVGTKQYSGIHDAPADIFNVNAPETLEMYNADDTNIFLDVTTGLAKDVDPYDIPENTGDKILSSDNGITVADPAQTGDCLSQTEKWHGI